MLSHSFNFHPYILTKSGALNDSSMLLILCSLFWPNHLAPLATSPSKNNNYSLHLHVDSTSTSKAQQRIPDSKVDRTPICRPASTPPLRVSPEARHARRSASFARRCARFRGCDRQGRAVSACCPFFALGIWVRSCCVGHRLPSVPFLGRRGFQRFRPAFVRPTHFEAVYDQLCYHTCCFVRKGLHCKTLGC